RGREVEVAVREVQKNVYEVRASDLRLTLKPGEYWVGLTPIASDTTDSAWHLLVRSVPDARFEDVFRSPDREGDLGNWRAIGPSDFQALGWHLSIRIEGRDVRRGQVFESSVEKGDGAKHLHLRFGTFDPSADAPKNPKDLMAGEDGKLWIVQC